MIVAIHRFARGLLLAFTLFMAFSSFVGLLSCAAAIISGYPISAGVLLLLLACTGAGYLLVEGLSPGLVSRKFWRSELPVNVNSGFVGILSAVAELRLLAEHRSGIYLGQVGNQELRLLKEVIERLESSSWESPSYNEEDKQFASELLDIAKEHLITRAELFEFVRSSLRLRLGRVDRKRRLAALSSLERSSWE